MAKDRIYKVTDKNSGLETLVTAPSLKKAVEQCTDNRFEGSVASADDVTRMVNNGAKVQTFQKVPLMNHEADKIAAGAQKAAEDLIRATTPQGGFVPAAATVNVTNDNPSAQHADGTANTQFAADPQAVANAEAAAHDQAKEEEAESDAVVQEKNAE